MIDSQLTLDEILFNNDEVNKKLGLDLYKHITQMASDESKTIQEQDYIDYVQHLVVLTNNKTLFEKLGRLLDVNIEIVPDKWYRLYDLDFFIKVLDKYIGIQIKPVSAGIQLAQIYKEKNIQEKTHLKFTQKYGGKVFYIYSKAKDKRKEIVNMDVIDEIKKEIERLYGNI
jgi:hypothetical protein